MITPLDIITQFDLDSASQHTPFLVACDFAQEHGLVLFGMFLAQEHHWLRQRRFLSWENLGGTFYARNGEGYGFDWLDNDGAGHSQAIGYGLENQYQKDPYRGFGYGHEGGELRNTGSGSGAGLGYGNHAGFFENYAHHQSLKRRLADGSGTGQGHYGPEPLPNGSGGDPYQHRHQIMMQLQELTQEKTP